MENPMKNAPVPKFQKVEVEPFTQEEITRMLKACTYSREADTFIRRKFAMRRPTSNRDQAIILTLFDSGMVRKEAQRAVKVGRFTWVRPRDTRSGGTWLNGRMVRMQMLLYLRCVEGDRFVHLLYST